jgi:hypothetical protein
MIHALPLLAAMFASSASALPTPLPSLPAAAVDSDPTHLTINPDTMATLVLPSEIRAITVGARTMDIFSAEATADPFHHTDAWDLSRAKLPDEGFFSSIGSLFDVTSTSRGPFSIDDVHILAATGTVQPYLLYYHEYDDLSDTGHVGFGGGAALILGPHANFGSEFIVFPSHTFLDDPSFPESANDTRFMTRLEITF